MNSSASSNIALQKEQQLLLKKFSQFECGLGYRQEYGNKESCNSQI